MAVVNEDAETVMIEIPVCAEVEPTTWGLHIDTKLSPDQSHTLRRIALALDRQQAVLAGGKRVVNPTDAIKYLLEQVAGG